MDFDQTRAACASLLSSPETLAAFLGNASPETVRGARFVLSHVARGTLTDAAASAREESGEGEVKIVEVSKR